MGRTKTGARAITVRELSRITKSGRYSVGDGCYMQISGNNGRSWLFRYQRNGRGHWLGLGPASLVTLQEARQRAREARRLLFDGADPLQVKAAKRAQASFAVAPAVTFRDAAERYIASHETGWRSAIHRRQWPATLATYVYPVFGGLPVAAVDTGLVLQVIEPIWASKPETASRVRGRIEAVIDWAKARGYRDGENPARWRGHLDHLLPDRRKVRSVEHLAALPWAGLPAFMAELRQRETIAARALEFAILTAGRTGEVLGARWDEISGDVWTVPARRMKGGREHRVPLASCALDLLAELPREGEFVFSGVRSGKPLGKMALLVMLRRMGRGDITPHGFRSTFRDWCAERTSYPREVAEAALAHAIENRVEAAYRRGDLFEKRLRLMEEWANYCASPAVARGAVVPLRGGVQ